MAKVQRVVDIYYLLHIQKLIWFHPDTHLNTGINACRIQSRYYKQLPGVNRETVFLLLRYCLYHSIKKDFSANLHVPLVDLVDDLQVTWQKVLEKVNRPTLQSLWKDGVVSVGTGSHGDVPCLQDKRVEGRGIKAYVREE